MPVNSTHPDYDLMRPEWDLNNTMIGGSMSVKRKFDQFIVDPFKDSETDKKEKYRKLSVFTEFSFRTVEALKGMAFAKQPKALIPQSIEYIRTNCDANGNDLTQAKKGAVHGVLANGRYGLLVDYPMVDEALTRAQIRSMGLRASIFGYKATQIINWRISQDKLSLVVLVESYDKKDDGFETEKGLQHRVLRLVDGVYVVEIYQDEKLVASYQPRDAQGNLFDHIPFYFVGALNNDASCDRPPMSAICDLNRAYYQNSCDLELHTHISSAGTLHISLGQDESNETFAEANSEGVKVGTYSVILTQSGGTVQFVEPPSNNLIMAVREEKRNEMILLGAKLIKTDTGNMTATQAGIIHQGETSTLSDVVDNVASAYTKALYDVALFMVGQLGEGEIMIEFDKTFYEQATDAQLMAQIYSAVMGGYFSKKDWHNFLLRNGLTDEEDYQTWSDTLDDEVAL